MDIEKNKNEDDLKLLLNKLNHRLVKIRLGGGTKKIEKFKLDSNKTFNATLAEETQTLNEVVVKSKRPVIRQTAEKLVVEATEMAIWQ